MDISKDKKTYTFKLRDAKWSDGEPVKAQDFEYSWKRALDPKTKSEYAYMLYPVRAEKFNTKKGKAEDVGVKALDDKTLEVKLEQPVPLLPRSRRLSPLSTRSVRTLWKSMANNTPPSRTR